MEQGLCQVCNQDQQWHIDHKPKHQYKPPGEDSIIQLTESSTPAPVVRGGDPILRMALVHAGVITEDHITQATAWVEAAREHGKALVLLPDGDGQMQFHLVDFDEAVALKAQR